MGKRAQRIPSWPGVIHSNKGRIHLRRPTCDILTIRLRRSGGPYIPQGAGVRSLDGGGSSRTLHRRPAEAARYQQTWELLLAKTVRARRTCGDATTYEAVFRSECLAGTAHIAHAPQRRRRGVSE